MAMSTRGDLADRIELVADTDALVLLDRLESGSTVRQQIGVLRDLAELYRVAREIRGAGEVAPARRVGRQRKDGF